MRPADVVDVDLEPVQIVAPDGTTHDPPDALGPAAELQALHRTMVLTRQLDEEFVILQRQGQLALFPSCRGQEAAQVGAAAAARADDWLFPSYRELGVFVVRGIDPGGVGAAWRGTWNGGYGFIERRVTPLSIPIGTNALHAVGSAMASQLLGDDLVSIAFFGDGATSEGDVHEALNLAAVRQAPCVFFVQNNQWAISVPVHEQLHAPSIAHKAIGYGMPGVRVDGNDVLACRRVVADAVERARAGGGPTLIEAITYRLGPHTTSDDPRRYRTQEEVAHWEQLDPLLRSRRFLERARLWDDAAEREAMAAAAELRAALRAAVYDAPDEPVDDIFTAVFAEITPALEEQRTAMAEEESHVLAEEDR